MTQSAEHPVFSGEEMEEAIELCEWLEYRRQHLKQDNDEARALDYWRTGDEG
jgi:hypothetical protein